MQIMELKIIPDPDDEDAANIFVEGRIDERNYDFLVDTGAAISSIKSDPFLVKYPIKGIHKSSGAFQEIEADVIILPEIEIGPIRKTDFKLTRKSSDNPLQNIIGMDVWKEFACLFRFQKARLLLDPPVSEITKDQLNILKLGERGHPYIPINFSSSIANGVWDTGAGITIVDKKYILKHPDHFIAKGISIGTDASGAQQETQMYQMLDIHIDNHMFPPHTIAAVDFTHLNAHADRPMDMILGYSTLCHVDWYFDFPNLKWAIL